MKRLLFSILAATALGASSGAVAADPPVYGVWVREGHPTDKLEFFDCAGKLCAKGALPLPDGTPAPLILKNAAKTGRNSWEGDLFNPEDGKTYTGKITYDSANQLTMTGCLVAFLCQSETWTRVSGPPKPAADAKGEPKAESKGSAADAAKAADKTPDAAKAPVGQETPKQDAAKATKAAAPKPAAAKPAAAKPAAAKGAAPAKPADSRPAAAKPAPAQPKPAAEDE